MPSTTFAAAAGTAIALLANSASAHLIMQKPVPFGVDSLDNSPLEDAFPGNYPCKQRTGVYDITTMNFMKVGEPQELSFEGSASHGGGTCQLAVSLDTEPTPDSTFKIIQVFEGGCPISADGNSGTHPFTFTIPEGFPNGVSTFAWFWNNRIGNREAYMNCAPITVSGGADDLSYYDSLPNLFLANLPSSDCEAPESQSLKVPNPGQFVMKSGDELVEPVGAKCKAYAASQTEGVQGYQSATKPNIAAYKAPANAAASTGKPQPNATPASELGGGSGGGGGGAGGSPPAATSAPAAPPAGGSGSPPAGDSAQPPMGGGYSAPATSAAGGGQQVTMSTLVSSAPAAPATSSAAAAPSYPQASISSGAGVAAPSGAVPSGTSSSGGACSGSGGIECSPDGSQFGMCTAGGEMVWQAVASGTKCRNGSIEKREEGDEVRARNPHVRRHVRGAGVHKRFEF